MALVSQLALEALISARKWVHARLTLKRALDSKSATPQQIENCKQMYNKTGEELVAGVLKLEKVLQQTGGKFPTKAKSSGPFPWKELFGMISMGAKAAESALNPPEVKVQVVDSKTPGKVIDAEFE